MCIYIYVYIVVERDEAFIGLIVACCLLLTSKMRLIYLMSSNV